MCFAKCAPASIFAFNRSHLLRNRTIGVSANSLFETIDVHSWTESACAEKRDMSEDARWLCEGERRTDETVHIRIFRKDLVETGDWSEKDDGIHVIEEGNPRSCQKANRIRIRIRPLRSRWSSYRATRKKNPVINHRSDQ